MKVNIHSPFRVSQYLENLVNERLEKLDQIYDRSIHAEVFFKTKEGTGVVDDKEIEIELKVPGQMLFASANSSSFEKAIPLASEKMKKQLVKYKDHLTSKR